MPRHDHVDLLVRVPRPLKAQMDAIAAAEGRSKGERVPLRVVVVRALEEYVKQHGTSPKEEEG
jgi:hypothetical protein